MMRVIGRSQSSFPPLVGELVGAAVGEHALKPAFEDGREVQPEHRGDEREAVGGIDLRPLLARVLRGVLADEPGDLLRCLVAHPPRREVTPDGAAGHVLEHLPPEVHRLQDVGWDVLVQVGGQVARAEHGVELDRVQVDYLHVVSAFA
jgi:hypothetical protein